MSERRKRVVITPAYGTEWSGADDLRFAVDDSRIEVTHKGEMIGSFPAAAVAVHVEFEGAQRGDTNSSNFGRG